jgi:alcohol dehydrogenase (NADP+)
MFVRSRIPSMQAASSRVSQISSHIQRNQSRSMALVTHHKLNTGTSIPAIGFGTWQDKDDQEKAVSEALKAGFRHIDGAASWLLPLDCCASC